MTQQQFDQLMQILGQIGNTAYQAAYQQALTNSRVDAFLSGLAAVVVVMGMLATFWAFRLALKRIKDEPNSDNEQVWGMLGVITTIVSIVATIIAIGCGLSAYKEMANPTWYAIQYLSQLVRGG